MRMPSLRTGASLLLGAATASAAFPVPSQEAAPRWSIATRVVAEIDASSPGASARAPYHYLERTWLLLAKEGGAVLGVERAVSPFGTLSAVELRSTDAGVILEPGSLDLGHGFEFRWQQFELSLRDGNGDGVLDSGEGEAVGVVHGITGDVTEAIDVTLGLRAAPDTTALILTLQSADRAPPPLTPVEPLLVGFSEPAEWDTVGPALRIEAAGVEVAGAFEPFPMVAGMTVGASFRPAALLPFGAALSVAADGARDVAGNAAVATAAVDVIDDPGSLTVNPGFEEGLRGWSGAGEVRVTGRHEMDEPAAGGAQALVSTGGRLLGALDVPANAGELLFRAGVYSEGGMFDAGRSVVVTVSDGTTRVTVFDAATLASSSEVCDCAELRHRITPADVRVDLRAYRGRRILLVANVRAAGYFGLNYYALLLDDFRVVRGE